MSNRNRTFAINKTAGAAAPAAGAAAPAAIDFYGADVFNEQAIRKHLAKDVAEKILDTINRGAPLAQEIAGDVAHAMKTWAVERGATHYTHWFQPLTGGTAEKHDSFVEPGGGGRAFFAFSGKNLVMGEPDASSFPSGGIRSTFEARGYTAWDPSSPAFIKRHANGATLCIPTAFCSYTGEALDKKTPLLKSIQALKRSVGRLLDVLQIKRAQGDVVSVSLGAEQEYFLIDKAFYLNRPDLVQTGRTLFGAPPPKHQQLEDHYFGAIKPRVIRFMNEAEDELWRLGIPAKTRHNETAPAQFELAPLFEELNVAVDHNMLVMEALRQVADRHGLVCLLHEKPFAGVNGSGKHNNWSVACGKRNLLDPGNDPEQNMIFMAMLSAVIRGVDSHADLLRSTTACIGNDHRLGASEAPPSVISVFLGEQLNDVVAQVIGGAGGAKSARRPAALRIGVDVLPTLPRDATDRNRTSAFAFTGNKFEFRAPGASQSCADANTFLNIIVADSVDFIAGQIERSAEPDLAGRVQSVVRATLSKHRRVIFNGNGYGAEWAAEAAKRGLPDLRDTPAALACLLKPENQELAQRHGVFTKVEMASRHEVFLAEYKRKLDIEADVALEIGASVIFPAAAGFYKTLAETADRARRAGIKNGVSAVAAAAEELGAGLDALSEANAALKSAIAEGEPAGMIAAMRLLRGTVDALEMIVDDSAWPLPKYREMLFIH